MVFADYANVIALLFALKVVMINMISNQEYRL